ncbi:MAG: hypothetical protein F6K28_46040 [Microcoleus sp. SIO2G3]|nr:hypothetical protein [Microcoleus sp. SIO2G3]
MNDSTVQDDFAIEVLSKILSEVKSLEIGDQSHQQYQPASPCRFKNTEALLKMAFSKQKQRYGSISSFV